jgi:23S rRNA (cytosine1962-C5)-methyltransferase
MLITRNWEEYELIDCSNGEKLEQWGNIYLLRPDPQIIWNNEDLKLKYNNIDAIYHRSNKGGGYWENINNVPNSWKIKYKDLSFMIKQMGFKHTGLFPEQAVNWDFMIDKIKNSNRNIKVLNLFGYTGAASIACLYAGASVVHVDSSRGMIDWFCENLKANNLQDKNIRYIVDDVVKFVNRELRRGNKYDAIIMDPPSYGRGPNGEIWKFEHNLYNLIDACMKVLSDNPLFFLINSYTTGISSTVLYNILKTTVYKNYGGKIESGEIGLPISRNDLILPCGIFGRWESNE